MDKEKKTQVCALIFIVKYIMIYFLIKTSDSYGFKVISSDKV